MLRHELPSGAHLRLLEESDADELFALTDRNREHLGPWMPWIPMTRSAEDSLGFIRMTRRQVADNDGFVTAVVSEGAIVGTCGFHHVDWLNRATSIGYWLSADLQGRGLMTEAVGALTAHAFEMWGLERIEIAAAVENARSRAVATRAGYREEGVRRHGERVGERFHDLALYAMLASEWRGIA